jgi:hypothetical protein
MWFADYFHRQASVKGIHNGEQLAGRNSAHLFDKGQPRGCAGWYWDLANSGSV